MNYESLKLFYLGRRKEDNSYYLYKNSNLTTHALIVGMTGSGKTGLGISMIEEACIDNIPSIIIDPKGDMGNLLLAFENLDADEFKPWLNEQEAKAKNLSLDDFAKKTAKLWENGLKKDDQDKQRIKKYKNSAIFDIYTPGSSVGLSVSILRSFNVPNDAILKDKDLTNSILQTTVSSLLGILDYEDDPLSKEYILLTNILYFQYQQRKDTKLEELISLIVKPPFKKVGAFLLDDFFPEDKRLEFALKLNNLLASPTFKTWCDGVGLDISKFLFTKEAKAKVSIFNISHLNEKQRVFFVSILLNEFIAWMRQQEGTSSLKAILYMDEIFGFFPPNANPSTKMPMLTLLKQARAYGIGVILSTQNPVDLDYKGLSNIGSWFIGRLQTTQDKNRIIEGLKGIQGSKFNEKEILSLISNLDKRNFLIKNIHENGLDIFSTRWVMSYLKGPLNKDDIQTLMRDKKAILDENTIKKDTKKTNAFNQIEPIVDMEQKYYYYSMSNEHYLYPNLVLKSKVRFYNARKDIDITKDVFLKLPLQKNQNINWSSARKENLQNLQNSSKNDNFYEELPTLKTKKELLKDAKDFLYYHESFEIYSYPSLKLESKPNEILEDFNLRIQAILNENIENEIQKLKEKYTKDKDKLLDKLQKAEQKLQKEQNDVSTKTTDTLISVGSAILGALFGRSIFSRTNVGKVATSARNAGKILKEKKDVTFAKDNLSEIQEDITKLENLLQEDIIKIKEENTISNFTIKNINIKPRRADIFDTNLYLLWEEG